MTIDKKFQYLMMLRKYWLIAGIVDVPILILLWWMDYRIGFWICLVILILVGIGKATEISKREKELEL